VESVNAVVTPTRIGILGCGSIGGLLAREALSDPSMELDFVFDIDEKYMDGIPAACRITSQAAMLGRSVDLVVEAAHADLLKAVGLELLETSDLLMFSVTALADDAFRTALDAKAKATGRRVYIPHGAMIGIDGIADAGPTLQQVTVTTTKHPRSLGLTEETSRVVYDGPTREACARFPRNVNVHASIALAGLGFDRTRSRIVSDPAVTTNSHLVEVAGDGYRFSIEVHSEAGGKVGGAYTPQSALSTLRRVCAGSGGVRFA
jgi:aspartate dehydrogenase